MKKRVKKKKKSEKLLQNYLRSPYLALLSTEKCLQVQYFTRKRKHHTLLMHACNFSRPFPDFPIPSSSAAVYFQNQNGKLGIRQRSASEGSQPEKMNSATGTVKMMMIKHTAVVTSLKTLFHSDQSEARWDPPCRWWTPGCPAITAERFLSPFPNQQGSAQLLLGRSPPRFTSWWTCAMKQKKIQDLLV